MIDYFALALGHGLMAIALLRLMMREDVDSDPLISGLQAKLTQRRLEASTAGRNAARRQEADPAQNDDEPS